MRTSPSPLDRQRKDRVRHVGRDHRRHAVRLEQAAHDAGFDVGVRAEDDDRVRSRLGPGDAVALMPSRSRALCHACPSNATGSARSPTFSRIIVMSSCCGASPTNAAISRSTRSRSSSDGRVRVRLDQLAEPRLAEAVVGGVHRLGDAVGEEHVQIAGLQRNRLLDRAAARTSRRCRSSGRAPCRPGASTCTVARRRRTPDPARTSAACGRRARRSCVRASRSMTA